MKTWGISAAAAALVMACAPTAQAAVRYVTGSATFAPPTAIVGAGQDYADALHVSLRAPTVVDFTFSFDPTTLTTPFGDEWYFKILDMSFKVNGVDLASSAKPFSSSLFTLAEGAYDTYALRVQQNAELIPGNPAAHYFQFSFDFTLDGGVVSNGLAPTPTEVANHFQKVKTQFDVRSAEGGPDLSYINFVGNQVTIAEAVPEPGTWALIILGFGATGAALRSRRREVTP